MPAILILGASRGIGLALAREYRQAGWKVFASARKQSDVEQLQALGIQAFACDITDMNDVAALGWRFDDEQLDAVILNAGVMSKWTEQLDTPTLEEFHHVMDTNVLAAMRIAPILAPMVEKVHGKLAVVSSRMGSLSQREAADAWLYRASKAALNSVLLDIARTHTGMISVALHPGWVRTDMGGASATLSPEQSAAGIRATLDRLGRGDNGSFYNYDGKRLSW